MKKCILAMGVLCLMLFSCKESDKPIMTIDQVNESWQTVPIKGVKTADVKAMIAAFHKQWPSESVATWIKDVELPEDDRQFISEYDPQHGYMAFAEGSDDSDSQEMSARVWQRSNGHQLLTIAFSQPSTKVKSFVACYDYDPAKKTLTPDPEVFTPYADPFTNKVVGYSFEPEGTGMVANEYFFHWWTALRHVYEWDGMKFLGPETEFDGVADIMDEFDQNYMTYEMGDFTKYALIDIDEDGEPELWLSTEDEEYQTVLSIVEGQVKMIAGKDYKRNLIFYKGVVGDTGGCGTGCYYVQYTKLKNSAPELHFEDMESYNFETDGVDDEYMLNGEPITLEEGKAIFDSFGEVIEEMEVNWRPLKM